VKREHPLHLNVIFCNKVTWVTWIRPGDGYSLLLISLFPPCSLSCNYSFLPSSISLSTLPTLPAPSPSLSLSLSLFLYQSAPLRVIYGFISSRSFCQNKITICAIEQKLDGFDPTREKKKERKERTRKYLPFPSSRFPQNLKTKTNV